MRFKEFCLIPLLMLSVACATVKPRPKAVKRQQRDPVVAKRKPTTRVDYLGDAQRLQFTLERELGTTKDLLRAVDHRLRQVNVLPRQLRRQRLNRKLLQSKLAHCFLAPPVVDRIKLRGRTSPKSAPRRGRRYFRTRANRLLLRSLRASRHCPQLKLFSVLARSKSPSSRALHGAFVTVDVARVALKVGMPRHLSQLRALALQARLHRERLRRFMRQVILPTFKDPDATAKLKRAARSKLRLIRAYDRKLARLIRLTEHRLKRYPKKVGQRVSRVQRVLARL